MLEKYSFTENITDLDWQIETIYFESLLTTLEESIIFMRHPGNMQKLARA